jgi:hypothetical protein
MLQVNVFTFCRRPLFSVICIFISLHGINVLEIVLLFYQSPSYQFLSFSFCAETSSWLEREGRRSVFIIYSASSSLMFKQENKGSLLSILSLTQLFLMEWYALDKSQLGTHWEFSWCSVASIEWCTDCGWHVVKGIRRRKETPKNPGGVDCIFRLGELQILRESIKKQQLLSVSWECQRRKGTILIITRVLQFSYFCSNCVCIH